MQDNRRPYMIFVRLAGSAFYHQADIVRLRASLPACTRAVVADNNVVVLATMTGKVADQVRQDCADAIGAGRFVVITVIALGAHSASSDGFDDPFHYWMNVNVRLGQRREIEEAEDMLKTKWGERRRKHSKDDSIADAVRKVFPGTRWYRRER